MLVSQSEYARMRGFSRQYIAQLVAQGVLERRDDGLLDVADADEALEQNRPHPLRIA